MVVKLEVTVVCAGAKTILDLRLQIFRNKGVPVVELPNRLRNILHSYIEYKLNSRVDSAKEVAENDSLLNY